LFNRFRKEQATKIFYGKNQLSFLILKHNPMDKQKILESDYLDIVFDNRNKSYGGYDLRRRYPDRAKRAVIAVLCSVGIICTVPVIASGLHKKSGQPISMADPVAIPTVLDNVIHHPPPAPKPLPAVKAPSANKQPPAVAATKAYTEPKIVAGKVFNETPPTDELTDKMIGTKNNEGTPGGKVADNGQPQGNGDGDNDLTKGNGDTEPAIGNFADIMPEFDGDVYSYLSKAVRYPEAAREAGQEARVVVHFVVHENGSISDVEVVKSGGKSLDAEAMRVVGSMPKWKPGKTKGKAIKVYYSLPIIFRLS